MPSTENRQNENRQNENRQTETRCRIAAGIVVYRPDSVRLMANLQRTLEEADDLILVENGAGELENTDLAVIPNADRIRILRNEQNRGIAYALNQMAAQAVRMGYDWLLTLDQDSICMPGFVKRYEKVLSEQEDREGSAPIGILAPTVQDRNMEPAKDWDEASAEGRHEGPDEAPDVQEVTDPELVITSGSCISLKIWKELRGFDNSLFIDFVDTDYQKRVLLAGYRIVRVPDAVLLHEVGRMEEKKVGPFRVLCSNHSPRRRYYAVRNRLYYHRKYDGVAGFCKEYVRLLLGTGKILLFENQKAEKTAAWIKGCRDWRRLYKRT